MPKRSSKQGPKDANETASRIVREATGDIEPGNRKNPAAVELGRLGGLKGGRARAASLDAERRSEIAKKAAEARWKQSQE